MNQIALATAWFLIIFTQLMGILSVHEQSDRIGDQEALKSNTAAARSKRDGVITGQVFDEDGRPLAGVQVMGYRIGTRDSLQFVNTDDGGNFKVAGLAPGLYAFEATSPGYVVAPDSIRPEVLRIGEHLMIRLIKGGVITGHVRDAQGELMVGIQVYARRLRNIEGRPVIQGFHHQRLTDDRGVYRLYGLEPGVYVVSVNGGSGHYGGQKEMGVEKQTYYPSATLDTAVEITLRSGEEISGIDIQHRGERGRAISGILAGGTGADGPGESSVVTLVDVNNRQIIQATYLHSTNRFAFFGVSNGEYVLFAQNHSGKDDSAGSVSSRVVVRGADVVGVELKLIRYGSISGRILFDSLKPDKAPVRCEGNDQFGIEEILVKAESDDRGRAKQNPFFNPHDYWGNWRGSFVSKQGEFTLKNLEAGRYRVEANLPGENWYIRAINQPAIGAAKKSSDVSHSGIAVKTGEKVAGIEVIIAEGAASLRGSVVPTNEVQGKADSRLKSNLKVYMIPAEAYSAEDVLRYAETIPGNDGSFEFKNLAPGKYLLITLPVPETESAEIQPRPLAWDSIERTKLRREAEKSKNEIELQPCQRVKDYVLRY
ncbi:MAG: carboxypeptidase-like regulatory domain-containing protein [Acidobacteria bacterium]|nr:carboxypeptidase-like regulatory domain-containing protein [Acidobacteriota bacterium]